MVRLQKIAPEIRKSKSATYLSTIRPKNPKIHLEIHPFKLFSLMPHTCNFLKFGSEPGEHVNNQRKIAEIRRGYHISSAVNGEYKIHGNEIKGAVPWHSDEEYSDLKKISEKDSMSLESTFAQT
jgi:hypothetical protein